MEYLTSIHQEIVDVLNQSQVVIIVNNHKICETKSYDGYTITQKNPTYRPEKMQLVLCENVMKTNYIDWQGEVNRTLAHESVHIAQICKYKDGYIRTLGFRKDIEQEAFAIQDQPREVLRILKKYCL